MLLRISGAGARRLLHGLVTADGANMAPRSAFVWYPFFNPGLASCRNPAIEQITRNVLNKFIGPH